MDKQIKIIDKITLFICVSILSSLFIWLFYSSFYFSSSFDFLLLLDFDAYYFHKTLEQQREYFRSGDWGLVFSAVPYGYGNLFWNTVTLLTWPSDALGVDWLTMVIPRQLSLWAYIACFFAFYRICREQDYSRGLSAFVLLLLASCTAGISAALRFHNYTLLAALMMWSYYLLLKKRPRPIVASIIFGIAFGIKITTVFGLPIFVFLLNKDARISRRSLFSAAQLLSKNFVSLVLVALVGAVCFSPSVILRPWGRDRFDQSTAVIQNMREQREQRHVEPVKLVDHLQQNLVPFYYHWSLFLLVVLASLYLLTKTSFTEKTKAAVPAMSVLALLMTVAAAKFTDVDVLVLDSYVIPLIFMFSLIFLELAHQHKILGTALLVSLVSFSINTNFDILKREVMLFHRLANSEDVGKKWKKLNELAVAIKIREGDAILIDHPILFPFGQPKVKNKIDYIYGKYVLGGTYDLFILHNEPPDDINTCSKLPSSDGFAVRSCSMRSAILTGKPPYEILFEDEEIKVVRRHPTTATAGEKRL